MIKKEKIFIFLVALLFLTLVSAQVFVNDPQRQGPFRDLAEMGKSLFNFLFDTLDPVLTFILGEPLESAQSSEIYLSKIMFFAVVFCLVWVTITKIDFLSENQIVLWVVSIAVSLLSTRWLTQNEIVNSILLPYDALGITLSAFLPILLIFVFIEIGLQGRRRKPIRKIAWVIFAVVFFIFWFVRYEQVSEVGEAIMWVYPISALICLGLFIFDGTIQKFLKKFEMDKRNVERIQISKEELEERKNRVDKLWREAMKRKDLHAISEHEKTLEEIDKQILKLSS